jgi:predicted unusual protein kinase regulating ubiquinone biosynthesis (AarF/ABC1/UbiB family)
MSRTRPIGMCVLAASIAGASVFWMRRNRSHLHVRTSFTQRNADVLRLGASVGATYASTSARKLFADTHRRVELDRERELRTAEAVAERLGNMKGALMKLGQMASYIDEGLPAPLREALAQLQSGAPPMSGELAAQVVERDFGRRPEQLFVEWDPDPIAAASIGQVHRAVVFDPDTGTERAVAVKVQYPGWPTRSPPICATPTCSASS